MAKFTRHYREPFDRDRNFVMSRPLPVAGQSFGPGDPFDKTLVNTRRLRQMYEQRLIQFAVEEQPTEVVEPDKVKRYRPASNLEA